MRYSSDKLLKIIAYIVTITFTILIILPIIFMISNSLKDDKKVSELPPSLIPSMSRSISIVLDYTNDKTDDESLKDTLLQDSILAMYSTIYEIDKDSIFEVEVYGKKDGSTIFFTKAHRMKIQSQLDYDFFDKATVSRELLLADGNYQKLSEINGYKFDVNGIKETFEKNDIGNNAHNIFIGEYLKNKYSIQGIYNGSILKDNPLLMIQNYKYYYKLPASIYKDNALVKNYSYFMFLFNTLFTITFAILAQIFLCSSAAYAISKLFSKKMSKYLLMYFLGVCMVPFITVMIPQFMLFKQLGMYNNYAALLIPWLIPGGFSVYLFKGFFDNLPKTLFDAIKIDGASAWYAYIKLCMPLSKSIISIIAVSTFLGGWNTFFWEWLVTEKQNLWTMNVALYNLSKINQIKDNFLMGISFVMILPVIIITFIFAENIKQSVAASGIKG